MTSRDRDPARMHDDTTEDDITEAPVPGGPLAVGGLHPLAWVFILLALVDLVWFIVNAGSAQMTSLTDYAFYGLQILPAVAAVLFPAALLARHPDAATRMPVLLLGTILFALVQLLLILATPLAPSFEAATPTSDDVPFVAMAELYNGLTLAVAALGLAFIARGLSLARQFEDRVGAWIDWVVPLATAFADGVRDRRGHPARARRDGPADRVDLHRLERPARHPARGGLGVSAGKRHSRCPRRRGAEHRLAFRGVGSRDRPVRARAGQPRRPDRRSRRHGSSMPTSGPS